MHPIPWKRKAALIWKLLLVVHWYSLHCRHFWKCMPWEKSAWSKSFRKLRTIQLFVLVLRAGVLFGKATGQIWYWLTFMLLILWVSSRSCPNVDGHHSKVTLFHPVSPTLLYRVSWHLNKAKSRSMVQGYG